MSQQSSWRHRPVIFRRGSITARFFPRRSLLLRLDYLRAAFSEIPLPRTGGTLAGLPDSRIAKKNTVKRMGSFPLFYFTKHLGGRTGGLPSSYRRLRKCLRPQREEWCPKTIPSTLGTQFP